MINLIRFAFLSFAIVLAVSTGEGYGLRIADAQPESSHQVDAQSYFSQAKLGKVFGLHRSAEVLVNAANSLPLPDSKKFGDDFLNCPYSLELRRQNIALQYMCRASVIHRSLSIADIIFPFHYFW